MATQTLMTAEEFDRLPVEDGRSYELIRGELIELSSASFEHNTALMRLLFLLEMHLHRDRQAIAVPETQFSLGGERPQPDVAVLSAAKAAQVDRRAVPVQVVPDVTVEIVSPSETAERLEEKVRLYLEAGVAEVWVMYPASRQVHVHTRSGMRRLGADDILESAAVPGFSVRVSDLFVT